MTTTIASENLNDFANALKLRTLVTKTLHQSDVTFWACNNQGKIDILEGQLTELPIKQTIECPTFTSTIEKILYEHNQNGYEIWKTPDKIYIICFTKLKNLLGETDRTSGFIFPIDTEALKEFIS